MAIPQNTETIASYIIYRDIPPGEPFDPTSPLVFFPPKGSDELFDALRVAFPQAKTHSERMRDAIIQYLIEERQEEQSFQNASPAETLDTMPPTWPSMSSDTTSMLSSPELLNFGTPATSFANSPQPQAVQLTRQASIATSADASPPSLDAMTGVFSVSTSEQPKQRMRRKMTEAEKIEYRKRRIVKACEKCAKRKRRCHHNQAQMENVPAATNKPNARLPKSISLKSNKSGSPMSAQPETLIDSSFMPMDSDLAFLNNLDPNTMAPIEDFNMFDDPYPEFQMDLFDFDNFVAPDNNFTPDISPISLDWLQDPTQHFQLQDPPLADTGNSDRRRRAPQPSTTDEHDHGSNHQRLPSEMDVPQLTRSGTSLDSSASLDAQSSWEGYGVEGSAVVDGGQHHVGGGDGMLWERLRTGPIEKPIPTHTAHVHDTEGSALTGLNDHAIGRLHDSTPSPSLSQTVLMLTGTKKAVKTFSGLLSSRLPTSSRTTAIEDVASALKNMNSVPNASERTNSHGLTRAGARLSATAVLDARQAIPLGENVNRHTVLPGDGNQLAVGASSTDNAKTAESRDGALVLPRKTRKSGMSRSRSSQPPSQTSAAADIANVLLQASPAGRAEMPQHQQRPTEPTLGEGLPETANPSLQLYMTRRRTGLKINTGAGAKLNAGLLVGGNIAAVNAAAVHVFSVNATADARLQTRRSTHIPVDQAARLVQATTPSHSSSSSSSPANGGAYPRLEGTRALLSRARQPTFSDFAGITSALHHADDATTPAARRLAAAVHASLERPSYHMLLCDHHGRDDDDDEATETPRLAHGSDTNRFRDHHGRAASSSSSSSSIFLALCLFALVVGISWLPGSTAAPAASLLLLALLRMPEDSSKPVQCSGKNSWWLSRLASRWFEAGEEQEDRSVGWMDPRHLWSAGRSGLV